MTDDSATTSGNDGDRLLTREFLILGGATMLFFAGMGASNPLLPKFVVDELGGTEATAGMVMGSFAIASLVTRSWFGRLGDRRGARRLMVIGCVLGAIGMLALVGTVNVPMAVGARLVFGAAQAAVMTGSTVLAVSLAPEARRGEAASYILVSFHLGLGLGPVAGEFVLSVSSYGRVWIVLAALSAVGAGVALLLPHRPGDPEAPPSPWIHPNSIAPGLVAAFGIVGFVSFSVFVPLYARELGLEQVGAVFMVASISIAAVRIVFGKLPDLLGPLRTGSIALWMTVGGAVTVAMWSSVAGIFVAAAILAGGMALQTPALMTVAMRGVASHERSSAMATFTLFMDLSVALTGPVIGLIVAGVGYRTAFLTGGAVALVALAVLHLNLAARWRADSEPAVNPSL